LQELLHNESQLLGRIAAGDTDAFRTLFHAYEKRIYGYAHKMTTSKEASEDVVQEVFLGIWNSRHKLVEVKNIGAYLFRAAQYASILQLKLAARETLVRDHLITENKYPEQAERDIISKEVRKDIQRLVDQLTPKQREVFLLSREDGLKHEEIAQRLDIGLATVKSHLGDALAFLRQGLAAQYGTEAVILFIIYELGNF
jgi:RNA polymerase sigma-70 factor (family 1)